MIALIVILLVILPIVLKFLRVIIRVCQTILWILASLAALGVFFRYGWKFFVKICRGFWNGLKWVSRKIKENDNRNPYYVSPVSIFYDEKYLWQKWEKEESSRDTVKMLSFENSGDAWFRNGSPYSGSIIPYDICRFENEKALC